MKTITIHNCILVALMIFSSAEVRAQYPAGSWVRQVAPPANRQQQQGQYSTNQQPYGANRQGAYNKTQQQSGYSHDEYYQIMRQSTYQSLDQSKYPKNSGVTHVAPQKSLGIDLEGNLNYDSHGNVYSRHDGASNTKPANKPDKSRFNKDINREIHKKRTALNNPTGENIRAEKSARRSNQQNYGIK